MDALNVPEPSVWADIAAELEKIAADCRDLIGQPAPKSFQLNIQPHCGPTYPPPPKERAETVTAVDTVSQILLGRSAKTERVGGNTFHHGARGSRGSVSFSIYQSVADPALVDPDEEIARLRAENEALRADLDRAHEVALADPTGLTYGRGDEGGDPRPVSPARVPLHTGGMTDEGLVDETNEAQ